MTISVKHKFINSKPDGADPSVVRPSDWNNTHNLTLLGPSLVGKASAGEGAAVEITMGTGLSFNGNVLNGTPAQPLETISTAAPSGGSNGDKWFRV